MRYCSHTEILTTSYALHLVDWVDHAVLARIVGWTASVKQVVVITVGYASDPDSAQLPASRRRPLAELVRWL